MSVVSSQCSVFSKGCRLLAPFVILILLAACSPVTPAPPPPDDAPKLIATVILSPTPVSTADLRTSAASSVGTHSDATGTPAPPSRIPPTITPTRTPYVGIFMGDGSVDLILPTSSGIPAAVVATLQPPTAIPGVPTAAGASFGNPAFPTAIGGAIPGAAASGQTSACLIQPDPAFLDIYLSNAAVQGAIGCPAALAEPVPMAQQDFEHGSMFWRQGGGIYALASSVTGSGQFWRVDDLWSEGQPESDPALSPPQPHLVQPIRGFGLAWRSNAQIQSTLGWGIGGETGYTGQWQSFERGIMFTAQTGVAYALVPVDTPITQGQYFGPLY